MSLADALAEQTVVGLEACKAIQRPVLDLLLEARELLQYARDELNRLGVDVSVLAPIDLFLAKIEGMEK